MGRYEPAPYRLTADALPLRCMRAGRFGERYHPHTVIPDGPFEERAEPGPSSPALAEICPARVNDGATGSRVYALYARFARDDGR
jgi:hypothetical protein